MHSRKFKQLITDASVKQVNTANIVQKLRRYRIELYQIAQNIDAVLDRLESGEQAKPPS